MITLIIVVVYAASLFGICGWAQKKQKERAAAGRSVSFLMAGRDLPLFLVVMLMMGNAIGGSTTTGLAQLAMGGGGLSAATYGLACVWGIIFLGVVAAKRMRELGYSTTAELVAAHCGPASRWMMVAGQMMIGVGATCLQYVAGGAMLSSMFPGEVSFEAGIAITAAAFVAICLMGGLFGASLANMVNVIVIYISMTACLVSAIASMGGPSALISAVGAIEEPTAGGGPWLSLTGGLPLAAIMAFVISEPGHRTATQSNAQCALAARDGRAGRAGIVIAAIATIPVCFMSAIFGLIARAQFPEAATAQAMPIVIMSLSPLMSGIGLAGLWAVNVSSGVALLMSCVQLICCDVLAPLRKSAAPVTRAQSASALLVLGVVTLICSYAATEMVKTLTTLLCVTPAFLLGILAILYCPKILKKHTMALTQAAAFAFFAAWLAIPPLRAAVPMPIYAEWPLCAAVFALSLIMEREQAGHPAPPA